MNHEQEIKLIFEQGIEGRGCTLLPELDVPAADIPSGHLRTEKLHLPELSENDISRHYTKLAGRTFGVNNGFYPLGSCTMKYNPKINEEAASLTGFTQIHPLQPEGTMQGCLEVLYQTEQYLNEITGMDAMSFQPAAGAHGELTGLMLIKKYHEMRNDTKRMKIIVPDSAHGTNPASAVMAGMKVVNIPSTPNGLVDIQKLKEALGEDTAGLMLTNPNTLGLFEKEILEITEAVHEAGGLVYYDGANLNAIMGIVRPGDMGFDCVHLNIHKTFSTPHGGGGPGSGPVGCKAELASYLPKPRVIKTGETYAFDYNMPDSIGKVKAFYGNFLVVVKALTYLVTLGSDGIPEAAKNAVLNANYLMKRLSVKYEIAYPDICMHEFVVTMKNMKKDQDVSAMDIAKTMMDYGMHPPTMYFPLIVPEALMFEPTETESKEILDHTADILLAIYDTAINQPEQLHHAPKNTVIGRPDEVRAARNPILRYSKNNE